jgi:hypothetical protein
MGETSSRPAGAGPAPRVPEGAPDPTRACSARHARTCFRSSLLFSLFGALAAEGCHSVRAVQS